jgi:hypothetical protein
MRDEMDDVDVQRFFPTRNTPSKFKKSARQPVTLNAYHSQSS